MGLGSLVNTACILILTTRGRKSGLPRFTALEYRRHGSKIYLISGWKEHPDWVRNLLAHPQATGQAGWQVFNLRASVVENPDEARRVLYMFHRPVPAIWDALLTRMDSANTVDHILSGGITVSEMTRRSRERRTHNLDLNKLSDLAHQFTIVRLDILPSSPELPVVSTRLVWIWPLALLTLVILTGIRLLRAQES